MPTSSRTTRLTLDQARAAASGIAAPTHLSDEEIERRAVADPDAPIATDEQLAGAAREYQSGAIRQRPKQLLSLRIDADVVDAYRATGAGWQARMHAAIVAGAPRLGSVDTQYPRITARTPERVIAALNTLADYVTAPIVFKETVVDNKRSIDVKKKDDPKAGSKKRKKPAR